MLTVDAVDARILLALDDEPDATVLALSRQLGLARNTVQARLRRLRETGALGPYSRRVEPAALGYPLTAFLSLSISQRAGRQAIDGLRALPEVIAVHSIAGDADLLVTVVARDTPDLHRVTGAVVAIDGVDRSSTAVSLLEDLPLRTRPLLERVSGAAPPVR